MFSSREEKRGIHTVKFGRTLTWNGFQHERDYFNSKTGTASVILFARTCTLYVDVPRCVYKEYRIFQFGLVVKMNQLPLSGIKLGNSMAVDVSDWSFRFNFFTFIISIYSLSWIACSLRCCNANYWLSRRKVSMGNRLVALKRYSQLLLWWTHSGLQFCARKRELYSQGLQLLFFVRDL